jgi:hypothetical protein
VQYLKSADHIELGSKTAKITSTVYFIILLRVLKGESNPIIAKKIFES